MMSSRNQKFAIWQSIGSNVLIMGLSGSGKSGMIREFLEKTGKLGESVAYYSPHAGDFVGDPITAKVLFFDNLNDTQSQKAAYEVLGLKLWKGKPVTAAVWGSYTIFINEVEKKPPAGTVRRQSHEREYKYEESEVPSEIQNLFEVVVRTEYRPLQEWFIEKFGKCAEAAMEWWGDLSEREKYHISPRMLANTLTMYLARGDIRDVLPWTCDISKLITMLNSSPMLEKLEGFLDKDDKAGARKFLLKDNIFASAIKYILKSERLMEFFLPLLPKDQLVLVMNDRDRSVFNYVTQNPEMFQEVLKEILSDDKHSKLATKIRRCLANLVAKD